MGRCRAAQLASIRQISGQVSRGSAGEYQADEDRYNALSAKIKADKVFKKDEEITWKCNNCGYIHIGKEAPEVCPLCDHPQAHFRKKDTSYI